MTLRRKYWILQCLGWGGYCAIGIWLVVRELGARPSMLIGYLLFFTYSIGLTHFFRQKIRGGWLTLPVWPRRLRLAGGALLIGLILAALVVIVDVGFNRTFWPYSNVLWLWLSTTNASLVWTVLYVQLTASRRQQEQNTQMQLALREAELRALESQINPHFLFNCLNSIRALVMENPQRAQDMVTRLANVMRHSLTHGREHTVSLSTEVAAVSYYLALEAVRFEDRLKVQILIAPEARHCAIPPMVLQILVENGIKHGISHATEGGDLIVRAKRENGSVYMQVENTGQLATASSNGNSLGLANVRERLHLLYGEKASLNLRGEKGHVTATVSDFDRR